MRVEPGAARLALAPRHRLAGRSETPDPDDGRRHADTKPSCRLPHRHAVDCRLDHATAQVTAVGLHHNHLLTHPRRWNQEDRPKESTFKSTSSKSALDALLLP